MKLRGKLIAIGVIPLLVVSVIITVYVGITASNAMEKEVFEGLKATAYAAAEGIASTGGNNYYVDENGDMWNGDDYNVTQDSESLDVISAKGGVEVTVFFGDTRRATSIRNDQGERILGTQAGAAVIEAVLNKGQEYSSNDVVVNGEEYFGYYIPLYNEDSSSPVGMVFTGEPRADVMTAIKSLSRGVIGVAVLSAVLVILIVGYLALRMSKRFHAEVEILDVLASGDLTVNLDEKVESAKDESGDIARSVHTLKDKLLTIMTDVYKGGNDVQSLSANLGDSCEQSASNIETVDHAVSDIAQGATSQAEDTTTATEQVITMGKLVEETNDNVTRLNEDSDAMEQSGAKAGDTLVKLEKINDKAKASIDVIYEQTNTTNESAQKISEAVAIITSIAEETNLLSLNASIEAARAGEQGKGFAVVAAQISKLAEQSSESAQRITEIVSMLIGDSEKAVKTMEEVKDIMQQQSDMVAETGVCFDDVMTGIKSSREATRLISVTMADLNNTREKVVDIVSNLSAIAEENAASSEETAASVTMVSASIQEISAEAIRLKSISEDLKESISAFKVE